MRWNTHNTKTRDKREQGGKMVDQTRWGIDQVQQENKAKAHEAQKEMRKDIEEFVKKCNVFQLQQMYQRMKDLKK
jgi:uncharacterized FlaG/YvyC family protein